MRFILLFQMIFILLYTKSYGNEINGKGISCFISYQENLFIMFQLDELILYQISYGNVKKNIKPKLERVPTNIKYSYNLYNIFWSDNRSNYSLDRITLLLSKNYINKEFGMLPHYYDCNVAKNELALNKQIKPFMDKAFMKYNLKVFLRERKEIKKKILEKEKKLRNKI